MRFVNHEIVECATAREFVDYLRKSSPKWCDERSWDSPWIFRGVPDGDYVLQPSAWRIPKFKTIMDSVKEDLQDDPKRYAGFVDDILKSTIDRGDVSAEVASQLVWQVEYEFRLLCYFSTYVDQMGLVIPGGKEVTVRDCRYEPFHHAEQDFLPLMGLAQHHGIPTRLLDWSLNPMKAAFFAAESFENEKLNIEATKKLAVWAWKPPERRRDWNNNCQLFVVQRSHVGYLAAQEGLFSYVPQASFFYQKNSRWPTMEELLGKDDLIKITLPKSEALNLLRILHVEGVSFHTLMPTYDNAARTLALTHPRIMQSARGMSMMVKESEDAPGKSK